MFVILAVMHIGKGQNMFYTWFDGKHIHLTGPLEFDCEMRTNKSKIFSKSFTTTQTISGDKTDNVSEYNDKPVRETVENLN